MKTILQPIGMFFAIFIIALAVLAMAACMAEDTVTPAVQVDDSVEGILPSRPQPPGPSPVEVEGRWRKPEKPKERSWYEYFFGRDRPIIDGAKNLFGGALNAIAAYIGMPLYLIKLASSLISLAVFGIIVWAVVNLVRTFKGKS